MRRLLAALLVAGCAGSASSSPDADASLQTPVTDAESQGGPDASSPDASGAGDLGTEVRTESLLALVPTSATFPGQVNQTSSPRRFTLTNAGDQVLGTVQVSLGGAHAADFLVVSNDCLGPLGPGATCAIGVAFRPATAGNKTAFLIATSPGGMVAATLLGEAIISEGPMLSPGSFDFGMVKVGTTSVPATWALTNNGGVAGAITSVTASIAAFVVVADNCSGVIVNPGGTCTFQVAFRPSDVGAQSGLVVVDAGPAGKGAVMLTGIGL